VVTLAEIGFRVDRQDPHLPNQALDGLLVDQRIPSEYIGDLAIAVGRIILVDLINLVHDPNGGIVHHSDLGFIVDAAPIDRQQLALSLDCQVRMIAINCGQTFPYGGEFRQIFFEEVNLDGQLSHHTMQICDFLVNCYGVILENSFAGRIVR